MKSISVDFGSGVTKIYMPGCGVVLMEATCIAVEECQEKEERFLSVKAYGDKARALSGRAAVNTHIVNPVRDGNIVHENLAAALLGHFLEKIEIPRKKAKKTAEFQREPQTLPTATVAEEQNADQPAQDAVLAGEQSQTQPEPPLEEEQPIINEEVEKDAEVKEEQESAETNSAEKVSASKKAEQ